MKTRQRNRSIRARDRFGERQWKTASSYSNRSNAETTIHRYETILGPAMRARGLASRKVEGRIGCQLLNTRTALGVPEGERLG